MNWNDALISITIGIILVAIWYVVYSTVNWMGNSIESYRYAKWNDKDIKFITHLLRRHKR